MDNGNDSPKVEDRRQKPRKSSGARVWADPGGVLPVVDCRIIDITADGAKVSALSGRPLPDIFLLQHEATRIVGEAHVVWRDGNTVGVKLINRG